MARRVFGRASGLRASPTAPRTWIPMGDDLRNPGAQLQLRLLSAWNSLPLAEAARVATASDFKQTGAGGSSRNFWKDFVTFSTG